LPQIVYNPITVTNTKAIIASIQTHVIATRSW